MKQNSLDARDQTGGRARKVVICSGHMIDRPERETPRFPPEKEGIVRERMERQLGRWGVGEGDLAICGGAQGADLIFAEACSGRGAEVWLFIPMDEEEFLERSVRLPGGGWEDRFHDLRARGNVRTFFLDEESYEGAKEESVFALNNDLMIDAALEQASGPQSLFTILVWDERETADGPGGTSDFASKVRAVGACLAIINPTEPAKGE